MTEDTTLPRAPQPEPATGANTDEKAAQRAHETSTDGAFITNPDGSKSIAYADTPQRREED